MKIKQGKGLLAHINWVNSNKHRNRDPLTGKFRKTTAKGYTIGIDPYDMEHNNHPIQVIYTGIEGMNKLNELFNKDNNENNN